MALLAACLKLQGGTDEGTDCTLTRHKCTSTQAHPAWAHLTHSMASHGAPRTLPAHPWLHASDCMSRRFMPNMLEGRKTCKLSFGQNIRGHWYQNTESRHFFYEPETCNLQRLSAAEARVSFLKPCLRSPAPHSSPSTKHQ